MDDTFYDDLDNLPKNAIIVTSDINTNTIFIIQEGHTLASIDVYVKDEEVITTLIKSLVHSLVETGLNEVLYIEDYIKLMYKLNATQGIQ